MLIVVDTAAQKSMISQSFADSLGPRNATSYEQTGIKDAEHGSYMQCHLIRQVPITIQHKQYSIDVAVGLITDNFITGFSTGASLCC